MGRKVPCWQSKLEKLKMLWEKGGYSLWNNGGIYLYLRVDPGFFRQSDDPKGAITEKLRTVRVGRVVDEGGGGHIQSVTM